MFKNVDELFLCITYVDILALVAGIIIQYDVTIKSKCLRLLIILWGT